MNKMMIALVGVAAVGLAAFAVAQQGATTGAGLFPYDDPVAVARGADIYAANCASCHGADLRGQDQWRTAQTPEGRALAPPHDETGHTWHHPDAQLFAITKMGTAAIVGNGYESDMAGYADILTDTEIREVLGFIKSTWPAEIIARHNAMNQQTGG